MNKERWRKGGVDGVGVRRKNVVVMGVIVGGGVGGAAGGGSRGAGVGVGGKNGVVVGRSGLRIGVVVRVAGLIVNWIVVHSFGELRAISIGVGDGARHVLAASDCIDTGNGLARHWKLSPAVSNEFVT